MTDKVHFDDLTKINVPFGLLDDDTKERLAAWPYGCEVFSLSGWKSFSSFRAYTHWGYIDTYRAKPAPVTQDVYPWDAMPDEVQWCARDEDGAAYPFTDKPVSGGYHWRLARRLGRIDDVHKGYQRGTCDWKYSLQQRPPSPPQPSPPQL
jgi:hypothetical protein